MMRDSRLKFASTFLDMRAILCDWSKPGLLSSITASIRLAYPGGLTPGGPLAPVGGITGYGLLPTAGGGCALIALGFGGPLFGGQNARGLGFPGAAAFWFVMVGNLTADCLLDWVWLGVVAPLARAFPELDLPRPPPIVFLMISLMLVVEAFKFCTFLSSCFVDTSSSFSSASSSVSNMFGSPDWKYAMNSYQMSFCCSIYSIYIYAWPTKCSIIGPPLLLPTRVTSEWIWFVKKWTLSRVSCSFFVSLVNM